MGRHGDLAKPEHLKALGGHAGKRRPTPPSRPTPEAIARALALEALGDALVKTAAEHAEATTHTRAHKMAWREDLKAAIRCFDCAGAIRYRATAAPPVVTPHPAAPSRFERLLAAREATGGLAALRRGRADPTAPASRKAP